jgi:hypothetical protein
VVVSSSRSATRRTGGLALAGAGAAQDGADPGCHLVEPERLGEVVVAARGERLHQILARVPGGEEDHGVGKTVRAQPPHHLDAVSVRQHDVQQDQLRQEVAGGGQGLLRGDGGADLVPDVP